MLNANRVVKTNSFGGLLRNTKNLQQLSKNKAISFEHDACCGISRKTIYFTDVGGKPIKVKYPINFGGKIIFNDIEFSKALTEHFGTGYIVYVSSPGNAVVLGGTHKKQTFSKDCCFDSIKIDPLKFPPTLDVCNCGLYTRIFNIDSYLDLLVSGAFNYLAVYDSGTQQLTYFVITQLLIDAIRENPGMIFINDDVFVFHFSCDNRIEDEDFDEQASISGDCVCTNPVIVETAGDLIEFAQDNGGIIVFHAIPINPPINAFYTIPVIAFRLTAAHGVILQSVPANTPLSDIDLGLYNPDDIEFFRVMACPLSVTPIKG